MTSSPYRTVIEAMFRIVDRVGVAGDFQLNPQQAELDAGWSRRNLVTKIRQHSGISSYVIARYTAKCLAEQNRRCVIVSAEADATARLLARARYILNNLKLPDGIKAQIGTDSQRAITFTKTGSSFWIGTAGSRVFGRGDTITDLHLSEAAFYDSAETLTGGLLPAAEMGEVTVESTGNGVGNWFHRQAVQAREGLGFKLFFFGWVGVQSCRVEFNSAEERAKFITSFRDELEEPDLAARGIEPEQLAWRRERLIEYEYDLRRFKENYPVDFDECFQSTGYGFFRRLRWSPTAEWVRESANLHLLSTHPRPGLHYAIGGDPAGGVGRDNSVAEVFCLETAEQVAEFASSRVEPDEFGRIVAELGQRFNFAYINIERNNHGLTTIASLTQHYPVWLLHRNTHGEQAAQDVLSPLSHYGTLTGPANRGIIIGTLRRLLADTFAIHSPLLRSELGTFIEKADGKVEADSGCFDDRVMATAMAMLAVERAGLLAGEGPAPPVAQALEADPFSWAAIFGEDDKREKFGTSEVYH